MARFTKHQDALAHQIAKEYLKKGYSKKRALSIGYATVVKRKLDPWDNPNFTMRFKPEEVQILYLTRKEIEAQHRSGEISDADYNKYWRDSKAEHLEEVAVFLNPSDYEKIKKWERTWTHKGKDDYAPYAFAIRCGGANQSRDPLNLFVLRA